MTGYLNDINLISQRRCCYGRDCSERKENGLAVCVILIVLYVLAVLGLTAETNEILSVLAMVWLCVGWIGFMGLKILKPQEALVLTLFGKYIGTLKGEGFYFVNPFCQSVNPAARTSLNQSGDVKSELPLQEEMAWKESQRRFL